MGRRTRPVPTGDRLLGYLLDDRAEGPLAGELREWLAGSPRFQTFCDVHRDKIRKKLRRASDGETVRDVRAELRAAHLLLADRRIELAFEAYGSTKGGPDFTVRFSGERPFDCEVTRMRRPPSDTVDGGPLVAKLRQLRPGVPSALVIQIGGTTAAALDIEPAVLRLRRRADARDDAYFVRRGFAGVRDFYARFLRLGAVIVWCEDAVGEARATLWLNRSARIALSDRAARACLACLRGDG